MFYPARYVLVSDTDSDKFSFDLIENMLAQDDGNESENENKLNEPIEFENLLCERAWQACVLGLPSKKKIVDEETENTETSENQCDFENPCNIKTCNCVMLVQIEFNFNNLLIANVILIFVFFCF